MNDYLLADAIAVLKLIQHINSSSAGNHDSVVRLERAEEAT